MDYKSLHYTGRMIRFTFRPLGPRGKELPVTTVQETGWAQETLDVVAVIIILLLQGTEPQSSSPQQPLLGGGAVLSHKNITMTKHRIAFLRISLSKLFQIQVTTPILCRVLIILGNSVSAETGILIGRPGLDSGQGQGLTLIKNFISQIRTKIKFVQLLIQIPNTKFQRNPTGCFEHETFNQADGQT